MDLQELGKTGFCESRNEPWGSLKFVIFLFAFLRTNNKHVTGLTTAFLSFSYRNDKVYCQCQTNM